MEKTCLHSSSDLFPINCSMKKVELFCLNSLHFNVFYNALSLHPCTRTKTTTMAWHNVDDYYEGKETKATTTTKIRNEDDDN
jgi:hypothetical protein